MDTTQYINETQALRIAGEIILENLGKNPGLQSEKWARHTIANLGSRDALCLEWKTSQRSECSLCIGFAGAGIERHDGLRIRHREPLIQLTWSSTARSPKEAAEAIALYARINELAALIEEKLSAIEIADVEEIKSAN